MIERLMSKIAPRMLTAEVMALVLLLVSLRAFTLGISSSVRNMDVGQSIYLFWVGVIAVLVALGLSKIKLNGIQASVAILVIGAAGVWILGARLAYPLLDLGKAVFFVASQVVPALQFHIPIDTTSIAD